MARQGIPVSRICLASPATTQADAQRAARRAHADTWKPDPDQLNSLRQLATTLMG